MATERERTQARFLLEYRGKDYSVWRHIRSMWKGYVVSGDLSPESSAIDDVRISL